MSNINTKPLSASDTAPVNLLRVILGSIIGFVLFVGGTALFLIIHLGIVWLAILAIGIPSFIAWAFIKTNATTKKAIQAFASVNNLTPLTNDSMASMLPPSLQNIGISHKFANGYTLQLDAKTVYLFDYSYERPEEGKHSYKRFSVAIIQNQREYPHIYISGKHAMSEQIYKSSQKLTLEGDFNRYFDVYAEQGLSTETLTVLTPDVMQKLIDTAQFFDIETYSYNLAVITPSTSMYVKSNMDRLLTCLETLIGNSPNLPDSLVSQSTERAV